MITRFCVGDLEGDVPEAWASEAQLVAAAPADADPVRPRFSIRRAALDGPLDALVDAQVGAARVLAREPRNVVGKQAVYVERELSSRGGDAMFEQTLWLASTGSASALTLSARAARAQELRPLGARLLATVDGKQGREGLRFSMGSVRVFLPRTFATDIPVSLLAPGEVGGVRDNIVLFREPALPALMLEDRARRVAASLSARVLHAERRVVAGFPGFECHIALAGPRMLFSAELCFATPDELHALRVTGDAARSDALKDIVKALASSIALRGAGESTASGMMRRPRAPKKP